MKDKAFLNNYFENLKKLINFDDQAEKLIDVKNIILDTKKKNAKTMIFGNGGSAAIASHFSVDLTKNARVRCVNFNESDLLTCFSNDFGYERWVEKAIEFYGDKDDVLILISTGGESKNMLNAISIAKKVGVRKIITFSGNKKDNSLSKLGDINFWVNSKAYNHIENIHQILLLSLVDLIIGKSEYLPN
tara:strand:+ start:3605 stop:4171 length:567 start_codon:yes stop_codon:yes gene_type:complete